MSKTIISYSDYMISRNELTVSEFVNKLSGDFLKEWGELFMGGEIEREELVEILKNTNNIEKVAIENRDNEPHMFKELFQKYLDNSQTKCEDIGYLIYCRGDSIADGKNIPYWLQQEFNIPDTQVLCIEQECSATLMAINIANALISQGNSKKIVILSRNFFKTYESRLMGLFVVSDGIAIMEISAGESGLQPYFFDAIANGYINKISDFSFKANDVVEIGIKLLTRLLHKCRLTMNDISLIIPQNTVLSGWNIYCSQMNFPIEKIFADNYGGLGHCGDVDMPRNITDMRRKNLIKKGDYLLAYALGTGTSWNSLILYNN